MMLYLTRIGALLCVCIFFSHCASYQSKTTKGKAGPPAGGPAPRAATVPRYHVLSYNICWECMTHSSRGSAGALGAQCVFQGTKTICLQNIARFITAYSQQYGDLDFVGLQEAAAWKDLRDEAPIVLGRHNMSSVSHTKGPEEAVLFYHNKFGKADIELKGHHKRPFVGAVFHSHQLIVISLHNCHHYGPKGNKTTCASDQYIGTQLSKSLNGVSQADLDKMKTYRMIIMGDFNDHHNQLTTLQPFKSKGITTTLEIAANHKRTKSCCTTTLPQKGWGLSSDYIVDSAYPKRTFESPKTMSFYDKSKPYSDHLPIFSR